MSLETRETQMKESKPTRAQALMGLAGFFGPVAAGLAIALGHGWHW